MATRETLFAERYLSNEKQEIGMPTEAIRNAPQTIQVKPYDDGIDQYLTIIHHQPYPLGDETMSLDIPNTQVLIGELLKNVHEMLESEPEKKFSQQSPVTRSYDVLGILAQLERQIVELTERLAKLEEAT